tara:strand:+ start:251 stop:433 length:183 start_codon:yes stop_codon:yes gene_type:complete
MRIGRDYPDVNVFLEHQTKDEPDQNHSKLISAGSAAPQRPIDAIDDEKERGYVFVQAVIC